jgi:hypothetical protein
MSWLEREGECPRCVEAAAYVLGALGDEEPDYREHLATCPSCQQEIASLRGVIDVVPGAAPPAVASDDLRERVMAIVRAEAELLKAAGPEADLIPARKLRWGPRGGLLAAAGALAAAAVIAILSVSAFAPSVRAIPARVTAASPDARAVLHVAGDRGELVLSGISPPPPGKTYEVWVQRASREPAPTDALFTVTSRGRASVDVPGNLSGVREVLVSSEPPGGSRRLTGPVLIRVRVRS